MTLAAGELVREAETRAGTSPGGLLWARLRRKRLAMISLVVIAVIYGGGLLAFTPLVSAFTGYSYRETDLDKRWEAPGLVEFGLIAGFVPGPTSIDLTADHWFGTDILGRDMFTRVIYSARTTLIITFAVVLSGSLIIGNGLGLLSGYRGGRVDSLIMRAGDIFASLPGLLMLILINAAFGERVKDAVRWVEDHTPLDGLVQSGTFSYLTVFVALSLFFWVGTARLIRAQVLQLRERDFVSAARATGATPMRIIWRHLLPNVSNLIILSVSGALGGIAGSEIFLTWFGVGVQPPAPSFGAMIFEGSGVRTFQAHPHVLLVPAFFVSSLLFAFALFGDALNDAVRGR